MSPYFQNIRDNRRLEAKYEGSALRKRAKAIQGQDDADAACVELHADAETRKGFNQHAFDFLSPAVFWRNLSIIAILVVAAVVGYAIYKDGNLEGLTLYAAVALAVSSIVALPFFLKQRHSARAVADRFPATIVDDHVTDAHRFVKTFGEVMPKTFSSLALAFGAGLDGFLAGWVILGALVGLPVFAQFAAAALVTVVFVALIDALGKSFSAQLGKIRARNAVRVKESALRKDAKHTDEVAYLRQQYSAKYTSGFRANRWTVRVGAAASGDDDGVLRVGGVGSLAGSAVSEFNQHGCVDWLEHPVLCHRYRWRSHQFHCPPVAGNRHGSKRDCAPFLHGALVSGLASRE